MRGKAVGARMLVAAAVLVAAGASPVRGQCGLNLVEEGVEAYQELHLDHAVTLLSRAAVEQEKGTAGCSRRARTLAFLGAAQVYRGDEKAARKAFRELVLLDPRYVPDSTLFAPEVTSVYREVRLTTPVVEISAPEHAVLRVGLDSMTVHLFASSSQPVAVVLQRAAGKVMDTLYRGPGHDSMDVVWTGRDHAGRPLRAGTYTLTAFSVDSTRPLVRASRLTYTITYPDGAPPGDPSRRPWWRAALPFAGALTAGGAAAALPRLMGGVGGGQASRYVVAGLLTVGGALGLVDRLRGLPWDGTPWPLMHVDRGSGASAKPGRP